jgi:surface protein
MYNKAKELSHKEYSQAIADYMKGNLVLDSFLIRAMYIYDLNKHNSFLIDKIKRNILFQLDIRDGKYYFPISILDTSHINDLSYTFHDLVDFNEDISNWDVSNIQDMTCLFYNAKSFNQDISKWDVSNVTNTSAMFSGCESFNQNINNWNTSKLENMINMFEGCFIYNQPLDKWNVSNVKHMSGLFQKAFMFNQDIIGWDISKVISLKSMFNEARSFAQYLGDWDIGDHYVKINGYDFKEHNEKYKYNKHILNRLILSYKEAILDDSDNYANIESNKYNLMKYMKQYSQHNNEEFINIITKLKKDNNLCMEIE